LELKFTSSDFEMEEVSRTTVATSKKGASVKRQERGVMPTGAGKAPKTRKKSAASSVSKTVEPRYEVDVCYFSVAVVCSMCVYLIQWQECWSLY
jgi:hypothetical protein